MSKFSSQTFNNNNNNSNQILQMLMEEERERRKVSHIINNLFQLKEKENVSYPNVSLRAKWELTHANQWSSRYQLKIYLFD